MSEPKIEPQGMIAGFSRFRKKPVVVEASRWFKNGDHPEDYDNNVQGLERGQPRQWSGMEARELGWEGQIVRYFRRPDVSGETLCRHCSQTMHVHGWIDTKEGGHIVCPGDWIITGVQGEHYPCKPDIFAATYEPEHAPSSHAAPTPHSKYKDVNWVRGEGPGGAINNLVDRFSAALREKLHASEAKYQWRSGWMKTDWANDLRHQIREHLEKGDPRDVAAYCAFAWHHEWSLASPEVTTPSPCCANPNMVVKGRCDGEITLHLENQYKFSLCKNWRPTHNICLNCGKEEKI